MTDLFDMAVAAKLAGGGGGGGTSDVQGLVLTMNSTTYVITAYLVDGDGQQVSESQTVDIPLESTIVNASYDNNTKVITFTLTSGATLAVPIGDIIYGLQPLIDSSHKLPANLVDDSNGRLKFLWTGTQAQWAIDGPNLPVGTPCIITDDTDTDAMPTANSTNPVESGGVYTALTGKASTQGDCIVCANGKRLYLTDIEPTGNDIPEGSVWIGGVSS